MSLNIVAFLCKAFFLPGGCALPQVASRIPSGQRVSVSATILPNTAKRSSIRCVGAMVQKKQACLVQRMLPPSELIEAATTHSAEDGNYLAHL